MKKPPAIRKGMKRQWLRCRTCAGVAYYDYVPFSFSNPLMVTPCGHGLTERDLGCDMIDEATALEAIAKEAA